jgi:hypothetical protein
MKNGKRNGGIGPHSVGVVKLALRYGYHQHIIAGYFGDNQGRVSEAKNGVKWSEIPPADRLPADFPPLD